MRERLNQRFVKLADKVSYAMGTPANIGFWIVAVVGWIALGPYLAHHNFLPDWFTSNGFNFPLNTVTTLAELYIGFLVAAATNRSQKALTDMIQSIEEIVQRIDTNDSQVDEQLAEVLKQVKK